RAIRKGETSLNELINIEAFDGTRKTILNSAIPIYDDHGDLQRVVVVNQEVTDLKRAQDAARDAAEQRLAILNALPANIALLNGEGEIIAVNEGWRQFLRSNQFFDDRSGKGQNFLEIFQRATHMGETEAPFVAMGIRAVLRREVPDFVIEYSFPAPDGTCWFRLSAGPLDTSPGAVVMYLDISARKTAEEDLRRQKELLQTIFDTIPVMIATFNKDGRLEWLNRECERVFGWPMEVIGQIDILQEIYPDAEYRKLVYDFVRTASKEWKDFKSLTRDGRLLTTSWAIVRLSNGSTLCIGQDLTHRRLLEEQLMQAQKMEGIGRLAGGVAHDFNNLLSAILGYSEFAVASLDEADPLRADIEQIRKAGERAADLTRQLLAFARRQIVEPRTLDLNELISATSRLLRRLIGEDIELVILQEADLLRVRVDPGHFEQVLVNLAVNARDAMPEGGKLCIETKNVQLDHTYEEQYGRSRSGPHVLVEVADTGVGMPEDVAAHAFEPFYTTKEVGKGTGLGLSTCYGIVKQAEGDIWIASKPGAGTAIRIYLPAVPSVVAAAESRALEEKVKGGDECILLVEDEPLVREMVRKALTRLGYQVLVADCGTEALRVAADVLDKIDLLLTDIVMPHMGGKEVADKLLEQRPGLKVLFMSGYTEDAVIRKRVQDEGIAFLSKPFTARALGRKVREVLDKPVTS
ncbi:MAG: response regulator, partial [Candidatus Hydrogenedentes bacterium]|nr:response regulator [Candidatus Hydrogenedentota bacterium]